MYFFLLFLTLWKTLWYITTVTVISIQQRDWTCFCVPGSFRLKLQVFFSLRFNPSYCCNTRHLNSYKSCHDNYMLLHWHVNQLYLLRLMLHTNQQHCNKCMFFKFLQTSLNRFNLVTSFKLSPNRASPLNVSSKVQSMKIFDFKVIQNNEVPSTFNF